MHRLTQCSLGTGGGKEFARVSCSCISCCDFISNSRKYFGSFLLTYLWYHLSMFSLKRSSNLRMPVFLSRGDECARYLLLHTILIAFF